MAGQTISAHVDEELRRRLQLAAELEDRSPSQIVSAALQLYLDMPDRAHSAIRRLRVFGEPRDLELAMKEVALVLATAAGEVGDAESTRRRVRGGGGPGNDNRGGGGPGKVSDGHWDDGRGSGGGRSA